MEIVRKTVGFFLVFSFYQFVSETLHKAAETLFKSESRLDPAVGMNSSGAHPLWFHSFFFFFAHSFTPLTDELLMNVESSSYVRHASVEMNADSGSLNNCLI